MIGYVDIMRCDVHVSRSVSLPKRFLQLFGAGVARIVSLHRFRLSESMSETSAINADRQQLMNKKGYLREIIKIMSDKTQSTFTMRSFALQ